MEALKTRDPERFKKFMEHTELRAAEEYRMYTARLYGDSFELSIVEFNEFLTKTGRTANKFLETEREGCPGCGSFGHLHRPDCA